MKPVALASMAFALAAAAFPLRVPAAEANPAVFMAGADQAEIKLPTGLQMWGYLPARTSTGTLDPLMARVFYFEAGGKSVALVTLDLGRPFGPNGIARARAAAREKAGVGTVIFNASHTHSGPYILDEYPDGKVPEWEIAALDAIADAIARAAANKFPARLGVGRGRVEIGHNRRLVRPDGSVQMLWANPTRFPTSPVDPEVLVLRIDDASGATRAALVGYACHPVIFGPDNRQYSADFPGAMSRYVAENLGGAPVVGYLQGGCGNINPFMDKRTLEEDAVRLMREAGQTLGREALSALRGAATTAPEEPAVAFRIDSMTFADRRKPGASYTGEVTVLLLNNEIAFAGMPGEPFVEFQTDFKNRSGFRAAFFMGYANGYLRYFPTIRAAGEGGYGANDWVAMTEVGAGERMMHRAYKNLFELSGRLRPQPQE